MQMRNFWVELNLLSVHKIVTDVKRKSAIAPCVILTPTGPTQALFGMHSWCVKSRNYPQCVEEVNQE